MLNTEDICRIVQHIGELLELKGESPFKSRAYFNAARTIRELHLPLREMVYAGTLAEVKGFGKALTGKISELVEQGQLDYYERLKAEVPSGLSDLTALPGLDRRKIGLLHLKLGITGLEDLERACLEQRVAPLRGFTRAAQQQLLQDIRAIKQHDAS